MAKACPTAKRRMCVPVDWIYPGSVPSRAFALHWNFHPVVAVAQTHTGHQELVCSQTKSRLFCY